MTACSAYCYEITKQQKSFATQESCLRVFVVAVQLKPLQQKSSRFRRKSKNMRRRVCFLDQETGCCKEAKNLTSNFFDQGAG